MRTQALDSGALHNSIAWLSQESWHISSTCFVSDFSKGLSYINYFTLIYLKFLFREMILDFLHRPLHPAKQHEWRVGFILVELVLAFTSLPSLGGGANRICEWTRYGMWGESVVQEANWTRRHWWCPSLQEGAQEKLVWRMRSLVLGDTEWNTIFSWGLINVPEVQSIFLLKTEF